PPLMAPLPRSPSRRRVAATLLLAAAAALPPAVARADLPVASPPPEAPAPTPTATPRWVRQAALLGAGFVTGFLAHETGHVVANALLDNRPHFEVTHVLG